MDVSYRWLKALAPTIEGSPREIAERLAMLGAPVDEIVNLGGELGDLVIARVTDVRPHPNADRLRVCTVDAGTGDPLQVVCGAPNVEAGRFYPFAPVGATLPGGLEIKKAKLRGETSEGMLCSARELGLGRDHSGLMTLAGEYQTGARFRETLGLDDWRLVVDVTPNRGELLSHVGIARELAPEGVDDIDLPPFPRGKKVKLPCRSARREGECGGMHVEIDDADACPRYMGAILHGVKVGPSPEWLATRLRAVGQRPINNVVDATNYVLQEMGQPLHAFDLQRLHGGEVVIRRARPGETLTTLDGVERTLEPTDLVIADGERAVALAGVMGGQNSEVGEGTTEVFLECALFDQRVVRKTTRRLGLSTDASYRFERGVDPEGQPEALQRVIELIVAVAGGQVVAAIDVDPKPFERPVVAVRPERVARVLGVQLETGEIKELLEPLGFEVKKSQPMRVTVPGYRYDVRSEIDVIEEIARRRGYGTFADALLPFRPSAVPEDTRVAVERRLRELFVRWGFLEALTLPFTPETEGAARVLNPLSQEDAFLRTSLLSTLVRRVEHNFTHGVRDVRLFEIGTVFRASASGGAADEERRIAAAFSGARGPTHWSGAAGTWDAYDLKALLEELASEYPDGRVEAGEVRGVQGYLLRAEGEVVGGGFQALEGAVDAPAWASPVLLLEATIPAAALKRHARKYVPLPTHPGSERDLALLVPFAVSAAELEETIRKAAGTLLEGVFPFDLYEGKGLPEGTRSLAWRLRFRAAERTLTDAEVDGSVDAVLKALEERHGVRRR
ncbi:MAG TPA: phenylalanine--tRNA ligase subunit beta [Longimicrobium sp.]|nr:phenylalanine--tRNA ligase subunit beta [Longimicrobium sp.]